MSQINAWLPATNPQGFLLEKLNLQPQNKPIDSLTMHPKRIGRISETVPSSIRFSFELDNGYQPNVTQWRGTRVEPFSLSTNALYA